MKLNQVQCYIKYKGFVLIEGSYLFSRTPTKIIKFCGNPYFVKVEGSTDCYELHRLKPYKP